MNSKDGWILEKEGDLPVENPLIITNDCRDELNVNNRVEDELGRFNFKNNKNRMLTSKSIKHHVLTPEPIKDLSSLAVRESFHEKIAGILRDWRRNYRREGDPDKTLSDRLNPDVRNKFFDYIRQWHTSELDKISLNLGDEDYHDDLSDEAYQILLKAKVNSFLELVKDSMKEGDASLPDYVPDAL